MIKWLDTTTHSNWQPDAEHIPLMEVVTVGFLISEDDQVIRLAQTVAEDGECADVTVILKASIKERFGLRRERKRGATV